ncbi:hypothetical protein E2C01_081787 [Portunus trituberculatus]|uniref:Uncharacterized protein n=1 Tax=Portunus trituberculatus TaxID=210409 RepID=A0A5B7J390_PORTR|nr:hypothetical protein [Portunus trituberculatus]
MTVRTSFPFFSISFLSISSNSRFNVLFKAYHSTFEQAIKASPFALLYAKHLNDFKNYRCFLMGPRFPTKGYYNTEK